MTDEHATLRPTLDQIFEAMAEGRGEHALSWTLERYFNAALQTLEAEGCDQIDVIRRAYDHAASEHAAYRDAAMAAMMAGPGTERSVRATFVITSLATVAMSVQDARTSRGQSDEWADVALHSIQLGQFMATLWTDESGLMSKARRFDETFGKALNKLQAGNAKRTRHKEDWQGQLEQFARPLLNAHPEYSNGQIVDRFKAKNPGVLPTSDGPARFVAMLRN